MPQDAPYFDDLTPRPDGALMQWLRAQDGVQLRALYAPAENAWGTVHLYNGRTEYIEKYGEVIAEFQRAGLAVVTIDWRGQGLSDRVHHDPKIGHIDDLKHYQHDADALWDFARALNAPAPHFVIGHSMGGAIALRAILNAQPFQAAAFTGPMWGIRFSPILSLLGPTIMSLSRKFVDMNRYAYGTSGTSYLHQTTFKANELTYYEPQFQELVRHVTTHPELSIGGPSLQWIDTAIAECNALVAAEPPNHIPALVFLGDDEAIVKSADIQERVRTWASAQLIELAHTKHECLMEDPARRDQTIAQMIAHFKSHAS